MGEVKSYGSGGSKLGLRAGEWGGERLDARQSASRAFYRSLCSEDFLNGQTNEGNKL